jgi:hypothetical protein
MSFLEMEISSGRVVDSAAKYSNSILTRYFIKAASEK